MCEIYGTVTFVSGGEFFIRVIFFHRRIQGEGVGACALRVCRKKEEKRGGKEEEKREETEKRRKDACI